MIGTFSQSKETHLPKVMSHQDTRQFCIDHKESINAQDTKRTEKHGIYKNNDVNQEC